MNFNSFILTIFITVIAIVCLKILHNYWKILKGTTQTQIEQPIQSIAFQDSPSTNATTTPQEGSIDVNNQDHVIIMDKRKEQQEFSPIAIKDTSFFSNILYDEARFGNKETNCTESQQDQVM